MASLFFNFAKKNYSLGKITEDSLDQYVLKGLITSEEKDLILGVT
jgi:hypothetical protein